MKMRMMMMMKMAAQCRRWWPLLCTMVFLFCWVATLDSKGSSLPLVDSKDSLSLRQASGWAWSSHTDTPPLTSAPPPPLQENFTCSANDSTVDIPPHIPQVHQEFLRYRHCRAFPTLLTPSPCEDDLYLLLVVKSTAAQVERRAALRDTWGRAGHVQGRRVKLVFLMGRSPDRVQSLNLQPLLEWEGRTHRDILQWDFVDSFFNLTLKEVRFLSWFSRSCSRAQFVFKGDDDVFVHTRNLIEYLGGHKPEDHLFTGDILPVAWPIRNTGTKYCIPVEMYPNGKPYPPYAGGGGYLMSRRTVLGLDEAAQQAELFPIDDVFVGMCLWRMGVKLTHHAGFLTFGFRNGIKNFDPCVYRDIMLVHKLNPAEMWVMWALMEDVGQICKRSG